MQIGICLFLLHKVICYNMSESGILLDYHGQVDLKVIELLLKKLKNTKEFAALNKITGKRLYSLVVECIENISKNSVVQLLNDPEMQAHISVRIEKRVIIIIAGNPITADVKENLIRKLDQVNNLDEPALKALFEKKIRSESKNGENGAGLGLIHMALKSGNKIKYSFKPLASSFLYFEMQITLNRYIMRKLIIDKTSSTPKVILDPEKQIYLISGESRPPDVREFYDQILSWLQEFSLFLASSDFKKDPVIFTFDFEYFNSSSGKLILDICKVLAGLRSKGFNIIVKWYYEKEDGDMLEVGKEMSAIVKFPFEYVESDIK